MSQDIITELSLREDRLEFIRLSHLILSADAEHIVTIESVIEGADKIREYVNSSELKS